MKSIMISIKPEWVEKILNGEKILEIRKSMPKCELPCRVYIYCTQGKDLWMHNKETIILGDTNLTSYCLNGKVVAEFTLNKIDLLIDCGFGIHYVDTNYNDLDLDYLTINSCLTDEKIYLYLGLRKNSGYYNNGYVWHIDNLKIYDKPKELNEFQKDLDCDDYPCNKGRFCEYDYYDYCEGCKACAIDFDGSHCIYKQLKTPPQSWCYVEGETK